MILLDASALIAFMNEEPGADVVAEALEGDAGACSVVNFAEILEFAERAGMGAGACFEELRDMVAVVGMTEADALAAAELYPITRRPALSLADRVALVTARRLSVPILTAESSWADVPDVEVRVIR